MTGTSVDVIDRQTGALNLSKRQIAEVAEAWKRQQEISLASDDREKLIAKQAEASACDLVILGTHGRRGVDRLLLGSDAEQIARIAPVPVMLVRQPHRKGIT